MNLLTSLIPFISALGLAYLVHVLTLNRADREFRLRKLDMLYTLLYDYRDANFEVANITCQPQWQDNEKLFQEFNKWSPKEHKSRIDINGIYAIYFNDIEGRFEELTNLLNKYKKLKVDLAYEVLGQNENIGYQLGNTKNAIDTQMERLVSDIKEKANPLRHGCHGLWLAKFKESQMPECN